MQLLHKLKKVVRKLGDTLSDAKKMWTLTQNILDGNRLELNVEMG